VIFEIFKKKYNTRSAFIPALKSEKKAIRRR
jgi:hypothetical protein